jgi:hypothetical protein
MPGKRIPKGYCYPSPLSLTCRARMSASPLPLAGVPHLHDMPPVARSILPLNPTPSSKIWSPIKPSTPSTFPLFQFFRSATRLSDLARRSSAFPQASPLDSGDAGEPSSSFSLLLTSPPSGTPPHALSLLCSAAKRCRRPHPKTPLLWPPLRTSAGSNRERRLHHRNPLAVLIPVHVFISARSHWILAIVRHLSASMPPKTSETLARWDLLPSLSSPSDLDPMVPNSHLIERVRAYTSHPDLIKSYDSKRPSARTGII